MKITLLLLGLLLQARAGLHYSNNHKGHPFREATRPRPVYQPSISKRRLDVWKPMPSEKLEPKQSVEPTPRPKQEESVRRGAFPAVPERNYVQLTPIATPQPKFASKQILKVQPAPKVHTTPTSASVSHSVSHSVTTEVHSASKDNSALNVKSAPRVQPTPATTAPRIYSAAPKIQLSQRVPPPKPTQRVLAAKVNPVPRVHPTQAAAAKVYSAAPKVHSTRKSPSPSKFKSPPRAYPTLKVASKKVYSAGPKVYSKPKGAPTPRPGAHHSSANIKSSPKSGFPSIKKVPNRPRYIHQPVQPSPRRPVSRPPSLPQNALFPPPKLTASLPRKPVFLGGHPQRKPPQRAQSRSDGGVHRPLSVGPVFHRPSSSSFTYKTPALPVRAPLLFSQVDSDERPYVAIGQNTLDDEESFGDLLLHLTRFNENDDYRPTNVTSARKAESRPSTPKRPAPPQQEIAFTHQVISPPRQATRPPPLFPKLKRQDVLNALDAVDQSVKPLIQAASILSSSFSLDSTRKQSVQDVVQEKTLDGVTDTLQFTVNQVLANPDPLIIISALLLSVITGSAIGNTINTVNEANIRSGPGLGGDLTKRMGDCPPGYEVVFINEDGSMSSLGDILEVRVKREDTGGAEEDQVEKQDRKGYPFRKKLTKSSGHQATTPKQVWPTKKVDTDVIFGKPGYYCKKVATGGDHAQAGDGGTEIVVNSDGNSNASGNGGQVSIKVNGVSVTVGGDGDRGSRADPAALEEQEEEALELPNIFGMFNDDENKYDEDYSNDIDDNEEEEDIEEEDINELANEVLDGMKTALIDSLRQIRSFFAS